MTEYKAQSKQQKEAERKEPEVSKPEVKNAPAQTVHQQPKPKNKKCEREVITMTNTEKAIALINTFATGDTEKASELLAENYIQHNLAYDTGRDAFVGSVSYLASAPVKTTVNNIRAFEDGDKVFLQTFYNFADVGEQVAFDIFRFDETAKLQNIGM